MIYQLIKEIKKLGMEKTIKYDLNKLPSYIYNNLNKFNKWID